MEFFLSSGIGKVWCEGRWRDGGIYIIPKPKYLAIKSQQVQENESFRQNCRSHQHSPHSSYQYECIPGSSGTVG